MENQTHLSITPAQPPTLPSRTLSTNFLKILILIFLGIFIIVGSVFVGIQIGKKQLTNLQQITKQPTSIPTNDQLISTVEINISSTITPTIESINNLKTHKDNKYGFSFSYPQSWKIETKPELGLSLINIADNHTISIMIWRVTGFGYCYKYGDQKEIIVGGKTARTADGIGNGGTEICDRSKEEMSKLGNTFVLIRLDETGDFPAESIHISYDYPLSDINLAKSNLNQILSTFKFTN